jgi:hypothetical protein
MYSTLPVCVELDSSCRLLRLSNHFNAAWKGDCQGVPYRITSSSSAREAGLFYGPRVSLYTVCTLVTYTSAHNKGSIRVEVMISGHRRRPQSQLPGTFSSSVRTRRSMKPTIFILISISQKPSLNSGKMPSKSPNPSKPRLTRLLPLTWISRSRSPRERQSGHSQLTRRDTRHINVATKSSGFWCRHNRRHYIVLLVLSGLVTLGIGTAACFWEGGN